MQRDKLRLGFMLLAALVVLLAFWLRLHQLDALPPGLSNDEAVNAVDAFHISRSGNFPLYEDPNRPEPLHRIMMALLLPFAGSSVWAFRMTSVFSGVFTIATAYWAVCQCLHDVKPNLQRTAALAAVAALAVALGHITLSRIIERGIIQPPVMFLFTGFLLRGLRTGKLRDFVWAGVFLGVLPYTYTAALIVPAALAVAGISLVIFQMKQWRKWLPGMLVTGSVFALLILPVGVRLLQQPVVVIGRSAEVRATNISFSKALKDTLDQFLVAGDENPQYNVENAPLLPRSFQWLFIAGLAALIIRIRQPGSALTAAFLVLGVVPVIASNETTHGLRIMGEFAAFPLVVGLGCATLLVMIDNLKFTGRWLAAGSILLVGILTIRDALYAQQIYTDFWQKPYTWFIHERDLQHGEWFYRTDRRDLARWLITQNSPLLIPVDELTQQTMRTWLMIDYPNITFSNEIFNLPPTTRLVVAWSLEKRDLHRDTRHYALLQNNTIILLPPFTSDTHTALLTAIDDAQAVTREGDIALIARVKDLPTSLTLTYEPRHTDSALVFGDSELQLLGWHGENTLDVSEETAVTYTLDWQALKQMGHEYSAYLQIQTQNFERITGDDVRILRWLYPTSVWRAGDTVPDIHTFTVPAALPAGAYRLVLGVYPFVAPQARLPVYKEGALLGDSVTIGWLKVPQAALPQPPDNRQQIDAVIGSDFALRFAGAEIDPPRHLRLSLYWEALAERPNIDATIFVHVVDEASGENITQQDLRPWGGQYPTFIWGKNEIIQTDYLLDINNSQLDTLSVKVGMYTFPSLERLEVKQNGEIPTDRRVNLGNLTALLSSSSP